jgi:hypothetical protein
MAVFSGGLYDLLHRIWDSDKKMHVDMPFTLYSMCCWCCCLVCHRGDVICVVGRIAAPPLSLSLTLVRSPILLLTVKSRT